MNKAQIESKIASTEAALKQNQARFTTGQAVPFVDSYEAALRSLRMAQRHAK